MRLPFASCSNWPELLQHLAWEKKSICGWSYLHFDCGRYRLFFGISLPA